MKIKDAIDEMGNKLYPQFVEVVPEQPTYFMMDHDLCKIVKFLFSTVHPKLDRIIIHGTSGPYWICEITDGQQASTLPFHPDTVQDDDVVLLLFWCDMDVEETIDLLAVWGITKVYLEFKFDHLIDIPDFLQRLVKNYIEKYGDKWSNILKYHGLAYNEKLKFLELNE